MLKLFLAAAALCGACTAADATLLTLRFSVNASGFVNQTGSTAPTTDPVSGSFVVTFDNAADVQRSTSGITFSNFNLAYVGTIGFSYSKAFDGLSIGIDTDPLGYYTNNNQFGFLVDDVSTSPTSLFQDFSYSDGRDIFYASAVAITPGATAVPEPATWMMAVAGFAIVGTGLRRRGVRARLI